MRLKYFLRGVGIGVIITTIILSISHCSNRKMTDNEIIERARELGMSFGNGSITEVTPTTSMEPTTMATEESTEAAITEANNTESDTTEAITIEPETSEANSEVTTEVATEGPTETRPNKETTAESTTEATTAEPTTEKTTEVAAEATTEATTQASTEVETTKDSTEVVSYDVVISPGMSSNQVSHALAQNGIVKDEYEFDAYLVNNGYEDLIRIGTFHVNSGMTYHDIAEVISGRR